MMCVMAIKVVVMVQMNQQIDVKVRGLIRRPIMQVYYTSMTASFSLRGDCWAHKASLTPPRFIEVPVTSQESERLCICVLGISNLTLSTTIVFFY